MLKKYREGKTPLARPPAGRGLIQDAAWKGLYIKKFGIRSRYNLLKLAEQPFLEVQQRDRNDGQLVSPALPRPGAWHGQEYKDRTGDWGGGERRFHQGQRASPKRYIALTRAEYMSALYLTILRDFTCTWVGYIYARHICFPCHSNIITLGCRVSLEMAYPRFGRWLLVGA